jgi:hypothetical protein
MKSAPANQSKFHGHERCGSALHYLSYKSVLQRLVILTTHLSQKSFVPYFMAVSFTLQEQSFFLYACRQSNNDSFDVFLGHEGGKKLNFVADLWRELTNAGVPKCFLDYKSIPAGTFFPSCIRVTFFLWPHMLVSCQRIVNFQGRTSPWSVCMCSL